MKRFAVLAALILPVASGALGIEPVPVAQPPAQKGLVVHEWGVFRVHEDVEFANADIRQEWDDLPAFVYGNIQGRSIPQHFGAIEIRRRPIVFFHSAETTRVQVKVEFPGGMPGVWWPGTVSPAVLGNAKAPAVGTPLDWDLSVKNPAPGWQPRTEKAVPRGHWIERVRAVKCDPVFARFGQNGNDVETEKFLYYDGLFPQGKWVSIKVDKDAVSLTNRVKHTVFDVTVVDRRTDGKVRLGRIAKLDSGANAAVEFANPDAAKFPAEASETLVKQLVGFGLFEDEARSLADLWRKELFERPGMHVFYRIPQEEYDRRLPLTIAPAPAKVVRAGLVYHGNVEPDLPERVWELVKKLDADDFEVRQGAEDKLRKIGPAAMVHLAKIRKDKDLSAEVKKRVDAMLKDWSAKDGF